MTKKRIGIIGTENSHAMAFAKLVNLPDPKTGKLRYEDMEVVGVYGPDPDSPQAIKDAAGVKFIARSPEEFLGQVDAMMITNRKGSLHADYARPFIEAGLPLFIDKPLTANAKEARELMALAEERGVPIAGGSGCKYAWDVKLLQAKREKLEADGKFLSGSLNFAADRDSEYDGFYFYAPHLTEMALTVFGANPRAVHAFESANGVVTVLRYEQFDATLHYTKGSSVSTGVLFGKDNNVVREIDISMIYAQELEHFVNMVRTGQMPLSYAELVKPVELMAAIIESLETGREVEL